MFNRLWIGFALAFFFSFSPFSYAGEAIPAFYVPAAPISINPKVSTTLHPDIQNSALRTCLFRCYDAEAACLENVEEQNEPMYQACLKQTEVCRRDCRADPNSGIPTPAAYSDSKS